LVCSRPWAMPGLRLRPQSLPELGVQGLAASRPPLTTGTPRGNGPTSTPSSRPRLRRAPTCWCSGCSTSAGRPPPSSLTSRPCWSGLQGCPGAESQVPRQRTQVQCIVGPNSHASPRHRARFISTGGGAATTASTTSASGARGLPTADSNRRAAQPTRTSHDGPSATSSSLAPHQAAAPTGPALLPPQAAQPPTLLRAASMPASATAAPSGSMAGGGRASPRPRAGPSSASSLGAPAAAATGTSAAAPHARPPDPIPLEAFFGEGFDASALQAGLGLGMDLAAGAFGAAAGVCAVLRCQAYAAVGREPAAME
jgi:hypothetical protein